MAPESRTLSNGLRVVLVPCEAESVAVGVFVASGSRHEDAKCAGISHFIEHMLFKGTPTRKPVDITRAIEGRGGNFNACTGEESTCYYMHLPSEYLADAVDILSDMYLNATIPDDEFAREKEVIIEEIRMYADEPDSVAMENLQRNLFPDSPLGAPVAGSEKSLRPLRPGDLRRYIRSHYRADNTVVVLAGAIDPEQALVLVDKAFSPLKKTTRKNDGGRPAGSSSVVPAQTVEKDVQQAQLAIGWKTFGITDSRKYAVTVIDGILGRGMSSRLFQEVREKRGLSYDIASRMQFFRDAGMFTVCAGLDPAKRHAALAVIEREVKKLCEKRVSAAELKRTKEFLCGNFRLSHEKVTSKMFFNGAMVQAFGRLVSTAEQVEAVRAVTAADVQSVAREIFRDANRSISWVLPKGSR